MNRGDGPNPPADGPGGGAGAGNEELAIGAGIAPAGAAAVGGDAVPAAAGTPFAANRPRADRRYGCDDDSARLQIYREVDARYRATIDFQIFARLRAEQKLRAQTCELSELRKELDGRQLGYLVRMRRVAEERLNERTEKVRELEKELDDETRRRIMAEVDLRRQTHMRVLAEKQLLSARAELATKAEQLNQERRKKAHRENALDDEQKEQKAWNDSFAQILLYREPNGDCLVPRTHGGNLKGSLGFFVKRLRVSKQQQDAGIIGNNGWLSEDRINMLNAIKFQWKVNEGNSRESRAKMWNMRYEEPERFRSEHGHACPTSDTQLRKWVCLQRERYKQEQFRRKWVKEHGSDADFKPIGIHAVSCTRSCITPEEIERLEAIGFVWKKLETPLRWDGQFEELVKYYNEFGHSYVPQSYKGRRNLGRWVAKQRELYWDRRKEISERQNPDCGKLLTDERIAKLESLNFRWRLQGVKRKRRKAEDVDQSPQDSCGGAVEEHDGGNENDAFD